MKRILALMLLLALLCGCQAAPAEQPDIPSTTQGDTVGENTEATVDIGVFMPDVETTGATEPDEPTEVTEPTETVVLPQEGAAETTPSATTVPEEETQPEEEIPPETEGSGYYKPILRP